ncbi:PadR family transcriptional regulator [Massilia luteola]|uniref:PadR family transcriptional regulator n=1 Tax=Massilia luteola TaxID=3081751 RepID=UPI002ACC31AA|nr:PadR family transcriptional regulator [Massilia sp. Gc5]
MRHHMHHHHHDHAGFSPRHGHGGHGGHPGRGGRPGGFGFSDDGGLPRGRKLSSDDLQLLLLALIADQPSHGYELIKALETRSNGFYAPSPGMMYPALACMEDLGWVTIQLEGTRKRYALSDDGRAHLDANREHVDMLLERLQQAAQKMDLMRSALAEGEEGPGGRGAWSAELAEARHALKRALMTRAGASLDEQRRIAAILARAAAEIEQGPACGGQPGSTGS